MTVKRVKRKYLIGFVTVDSGLLNIGDPCYISGEEDNPFKDWENFVDKLEKAESFKEGNLFNVGEEEGNYGKSLVFKTPLGDGLYNIFLEYDKEDFPKRLIIELDS